MSSRIRILPPLLVAILFAILLWRTDMHAVHDAFLQISYGPVLTALAIVQLQVILSAIRWRFTAQRLGQTIGLAEAIREYYVASLLNQSLPGGMGGDAIRAWRTRVEGKGGWKLPAKGILYERLSGQAAFLVIVIIGLPLWPVLISGSAPISLGWGAVALCAIGLAAGAGLWWLAHHSTNPILRQIRQDASEVFLRRQAWLVQLGLSVVVVAAYIAVFMISSQAIGAGLPIQAALTIIPLCLLSMLIPVGLGGWGTREAAAMALWPLTGFTAADGFAASLLYGFLSLVGSAPGLVILGLEAIGARRRPG
ncbi:lysylphosphatidylglycerol synthase transmembrane domain-containing protein [Rhizobium glycinendophyticum]|uniref:lysylphosphatidylglycerol synthase transmembrane domain-containing protein n=1 Tax=Rhizobium glycinendophyticum TaxID=2589807 RepID=UPI001FE24671|nr:lysylphosphatidylglycerol synthase transmembrane domain-containing protein [Rhizobium glycinendophyticum]